jgi:hypothetical protein
MPKSGRCALAYLFAGLYVQSVAVIVNSVVRPGSRAALNAEYALVGDQLGDPPPFLISDLIHSATSAQDPTRCWTGCCVDQLKLSRLCAQPYKA